MISITSLSESMARADRRVAEFRGFYRVVVIAEALAGLGLLGFPGWTGALLGLADCSASLRIPGLLLFWAVLFQVPGLANPVYTRVPIVIGVLGRYALGLALLVSGYVPLALVLLVAALVLSVSYHRMVRAVLMSRP